MMLMLTMPMTTTSSPTRRHRDDLGIDLDKRIVKLHLEPAVRSGSVRGLGRHHAGDQRYLEVAMVMVLVTSGGVDGGGDGGILIESPTNHDKGNNEK